MVLGKKYTLDIAVLILQIEKLIDYYDSKKISSRFSSYLKSLELTLSREELPFPDNSILLEEMNSIKTEFSTSENNLKKKSVMFKLLYFHMDILFCAYQMLELKNNPSEIKENLFELNKNDSTKITDFDTDKKLDKLSFKQKAKYIKLKEELSKETDPVKKNKIRSGVNYYKKILNNK